MFLLCSCNCHYTKNFVKFLVGELVHIFTILCLFMFCYVPVYILGAKLKYLLQHFISGAKINIFSYAEIGNNI